MWSWALECRLSSCGAWTQLLCSMWNLPGPELEPMSPVLAGGFLTTVPPGKPPLTTFILKPLNQKYIHIYIKHRDINTYSIFLQHWCYGENALCATLSIFFYRFFVLLYNVPYFKHFLCHTMSFEALHM